MELICQLGHSVPDGTTARYCPKCSSRLVHIDTFEGRRAVAAADAERSAAPPIRRDRISTLPSLPGHSIIAVHGVVSEVAATSGWTATSKGSSALDNAMNRLMASAGLMSANAVVGLSASAFGAGGGITNVLGGDAVGVLLLGTAVTVEPSKEAKAADVAHG